MFTIIYYADDWHTAERMADAERSAKNRAGVREARVFREAEACDKVVILPCVDADARARIAAAYGDKLKEPSYATVAEADAFFENIEAFVAKHRGRGSYSIMRGEDEIVEGLTRLEADAFKTYSPAEQAAFVANRAKG
jgi:hypothetical protein